MSFSFTIILKGLKIGVVRWMRKLHHCLWAFSSTVPVPRAQQRPEAQPIVVIFIPSSAENVEVHF